MSTRFVSFLFPFCGIGPGAMGFLRSSITLLGREHRVRAAGGIDIDKEACADFRRFTGSPALCADIAALTPDDLRAFAGDTAPDGTFCSAPCVGSSGLISDAKAQEQRYVDLNQLTLIWTRLMLATWKTPPRVLLYENVPGITRRAAGMLKELRKLLRGAGFVIHEGFHDCGEIGGLAQRRRRWLLVARRQDAVPALLYQPPKRRVRGVGEVLGELPMPGDPAAGPLHRLPRVSWLTWVRLALIPAGGDWHDLPASVALPSATRGGEAFRNAYRVTGWDEPKGVVTAGTAPGSGGGVVADPRMPCQVRKGDRAYNNVYRVIQWDDPSVSVIGATRPGSGALSVADPRMHDPAKHSRPFNPHVHGVIPWDGPAHTITATTSSPGNGPFSVADPRPTRGFDGSYGVTAFDQPAATVRAFDHPSKGIASVADPRMAGRDPDKVNFTTLGVQPWDEPSGAVQGESMPSNGRFSVADPRLGCEPRNGAYGIVPWDRPSGTVTAAMCHDNDESSVADPRIPTDWRKPPGDPLPIIIALDGTWHRPMTTLELAVLQGLPATMDGEPLVLTAGTAARQRMHVGNAVPVGAAEAIARQMLLTLAYSDAGTWALSGEGGDVWVQPERIEWSAGEVIQ